MDSIQYPTLTISNFSSDNLDLLTELVFSSGAVGTEEDLAFVQTGREYIPETVDRDMTAIKVYFEESPSQALQSEIAQRWPGAQISLSHVPQRDWLEEWKKHFKAFELCPRIWVVPNWISKPEQAEIEIRMEPGMAFGTGTHETTKLAAQLIFDHSKNKAKNSLIDVGTGTALLAILAEKLGFESVIANDIDPDARRVARENVSTNHSLKVFVTDDQISEISDQYEFVVANIIDGVLVKIQDDLRARTKEGGILILTGILLEREKIFRHEFSFSGYKILERRQLGEWLGFVLERNYASNLG